MLSTTNFWMCLAGLLYFGAGVFTIRKEIMAVPGWRKLISLDCAFIAASLAAFAPEHFYGPKFVQQMVPSWMPARAFWAYFVGCALLAAATSLSVRTFVRLSATLLGVMFLLFVFLIYLPSAFAHANDRFAWTYLLRDLSFAAGAWALAGQHSRAAWPRQAAWMILFGRIVIAVAATYFAAEHFLHPGFAPGVPLEKITPSWVPFPHVWAYLAGAILLAAGIGLALNKKSQIAALSIGALMTALTVFLYLIILIDARNGSPLEFNDALNYVADTLLFGGAALAVASALT